MKKLILALVLFTFLFSSCNLLMELTKKPAIPAEIDRRLDKHYNVSKTGNNFTNIFKSEEFYKKNYTFDNFLKLKKETIKKYDAKNQERNLSIIANQYELAPERVFKFVNEFLEEIKNKDSLYERDIKRFNILIKGLPFTKKVLVRQNDIENQKRFDEIIEKVKIKLEDKKLAVKKAKEKKELERQREKEERLRNRRVGKALMKDKKIEKAIKEKFWLKYSKNQGFPKGTIKRFVITSDHWVQNVRAEYWKPQLNAEVVVKSKEKCYIVYIKVRRESSGKAFTLWNYFFVFNGHDEILCKNINK